MKLRHFPEARNEIQRAIARKKPARAGIVHGKVKQIDTAAVLHH